MKREELMTVYYLDKEIAEWKEEIERIRESALPRGVRFGTVSGSGRYTDMVAQAASLIADTEKKIKKKLLELELARSEIIRYIMDIDDCQTRLIFKLRCLDHMTWNEVADRVGGMNSEYSVKKRFYRYLEKCS
ncbi:MAG: hypothetical protein IKY39_05180 [Clostridia bacterium]|nr:hypothetical protein [Clostridia bacterium]